MQTTELYGGAMAMDLPTRRLVDTSAITPQPIAADTTNSSTPAESVDRQVMSFIDISEWRQVPDHQEVRHDASTGAVAIVELLCPIEPEKMIMAAMAGSSASTTLSAAMKEVEENPQLASRLLAEYYFWDLATTNGCERSSGSAALLEPPKGPVISLQQYERLNKASCHQSSGITGGHHHSGGVCGRVLDATELPRLFQPAAQGGTAPIWGGVCVGRQRVSKFRTEEAHPNDIAVCIAAIRFPDPVDSDVVVSLSVPIRVDPKSSEAKTVLPGTEMQVQEAEEIFFRMLQSLSIQRWSLFTPGSGGGE